MVSFLADENFNRNLIRALKRREPIIDIVVAQEVGLSGADDPSVLAWAAAQSRVTLSHDIHTLPGFAYRRIKANQRMSGIVEVPIDLALSRAIEDLLLIAIASEQREWEGQIIYLPL